VFNWFKRALTKPAVLGLHVFGILAQITVRPRFQDFPRKLITQLVLERGDLICNFFLNPAFRKERPSLVGHYRRLGGGRVRLRALLKSHPAEVGICRFSRASPQSGFYWLR